MSKIKTYIKGKFADGSSPVRSIQESLGVVDKGSVQAYLSTLRDELYQKFDTPEGEGVKHDIEECEELLKKWL